MRKKVPSKHDARKYFLTSAKLIKIFTVVLALVLSYMHEANAQTTEIPVQGTVTADDGAGLAGVSVSVKGTDRSTVTDSTGNFTIAVPDTNSTLVFSYAGYKTQEIVVGNQSVVSVTLPEDKETDEVVVVGYGTQKKSDVTGAISTVKSAELNRVVVVDPTQAMVGRVTGVSVSQNSGAPGAQTAVRIRGTGTINSADPLYVVNGVPITGDISFLNTNDIESIDVLKDASSAAIYGSRAANGVILVTTKSGSKYKNSVDFNYLTGVSREWKRLNLLNAHQWAILRNEAEMEKNGTTLYNPDTIGEGTDWQDQIFRKAVMKSYSLSASGGSERANYYFSGAYLNQEGIIKNSNYERYNFNARGDYKLNKRLKVGTFVSVAYSDRKQLYDADPYNSIIANALTADPITPVYSGKGGDSAFASGQGRTDVPNPVARLTYYRNRTRTFNFLGNWFAEYEILKGLKFKSNLGVSYVTPTINQYNGRYFVSANEKLDESQVLAQQNINRLWVWENSLEYRRLIAENHDLGLLLLTGAQDSRSEFFNGQRNNTPNNDPSQQYLNTASGTPTVFGSASSWSILSYMARINYGFQGKYLLTLTARRDGTSKFPKSTRWGTFPSAALGWVVSKEAFFEPIENIVNFAKIRVGYGSLGNQNMPGALADYPYTTNISPGYNYPFPSGSLGGAGSTPLGSGNPDIKWETVTTSNIGIDLRFLNDRLSVTADYFTKKTTDMLYRKLIPYYTGVEQPPFVNGGEMKNKGWELAVNYRDKVGALTYAVGANVTSIKNKVTKLQDPIYAGQFRSFYTNITQQGSPIAQFYGWQTDGIVQTAAEAAALQHAQPGVRPGDFKFKDLDGDGVITDKDRTTLGSPLPKFQYGFNGEVAYMGFDFNIFFQGAQGQKIFNGSKYQLEGGVIYSNLDQRMLDRWTGPGTSNDIPRVSTSDPNNNRRPSNYYVENGSYLRVRSVQLGYTLPEALTKTIKFQKLRVFVMAQNLFTFTKYSGLDPEIGLYQPNSTLAPNYLDINVDKGGTYPQARTFFFGVNASF